MYYIHLVNINLYTNILQLLYGIEIPIAHIYHICVTWLVEIDEGPGAMDL